MHFLHYPVRFLFIQHGRKFVENALLVVAIVKAVLQGVYHGAVLIANDFVNYVVQFRVELLDFSPRIVSHCDQFYTLDHGADLFVRLSIYWQETLTFVKASSSYPQGVICFK